MVGSVKADKFERVPARSLDTLPSEPPVLYGVPELALLKTNPAQTQAEWAVGRLDDPVVAADDLLWLGSGLLEQSRLLPLAYRLICSNFATISLSSGTQDARSEVAVPLAGDSRRLVYCCSFEFDLQLEFVGPEDESGRGAPGNRYCRTGRVQVDSNASTACGVRKCYYPRRFDGIVDVEGRFITEGILQLRRACQGSEAQPFNLYLKFIPSSVIRLHLYFDLSTMSDDGQRH